MPEIGEVARVVHFLHKHIVGKTLAAVKAQHDENVFGKVGTSAAEFEKALMGKKVLDARQQGKYFWMEMSSPPHPVMHFGMAGWFKIRNETTAYLKSTNSDSDEWPPKYWKFLLETSEEPKCEAAFVDSRRFARIRLVDCAASDLRQTSPLKENGPDPVIDRDIVTEEWLTELLGRKKIPVKALLLDQGNISGIGNWVGDEIMYDACMHPEQYSNTLSAAQISQLHKSIHYVCGLAVETLADSSKFPKEWLFKHRWTKGKKDAPTTLPNGYKFVFLTVGGRTSAVVPSVQKKTGPVKKDVDLNGEVDGSDADEEQPKNAAKKGPKRKKAAAADSAEVDEEEAPVKPVTKKSRSKNIKKESTNEERSDKPEIVNGVAHEADEHPQKPMGKKQKPTAKVPTRSKPLDTPKQQNVDAPITTEDSSGRRRSSRAYMAETIQTEKEVPPYHSVDTAKIQRMAEAVVSFHPNKAELTCLTIMLEATLRIVKEEHSKKLEDIMREVAKEIKLVGVKPYHKQSYEEHEDAQANTLPAAAASAMDEEGIEDAGEPSKEAPGAAERF